MESSFNTYMRIAIAEAHQSLREGNHGFGAVITAKEKVLAAAHDTAETGHDPTAHAESNAIREACSILGKHLSECTLISTHEPCPMCAAAIVWARIPTVAFGYTITDAIAQGRTRINLSCQEVFDRANAQVVVHSRVLNSECSVLYRRDVREEIKKLRGASADRLRDHDHQRAISRIQWFRAHRNGLPIQVDSPLESAYHVLLHKLGIPEQEAPIVEQTRTRITFHSKNFCPTLEACHILGLDTRELCKAYCEKSTDTLVKLIRSDMKFSRNYARIRPYAEYCEEYISTENPEDP